jgi:hypothetical protein
MATTADHGSTSLDPHGRLNRLPRNAFVARLGMPGAIRRAVREVPAAAGLRGQWRPPP